VVTRHVHYISSKACRIAPGVDSDVVTRHACYISSKAWPDFLRSGLHGRYCVRALGVGTCHVCCRSSKTWPDFHGRRWHGRYGARVPGVDARRGYLPRHGRRWHGRYAARVPGVDARRGYPPRHLYRLQSPLARMEEGAICRVVQGYPKCIPGMGDRQVDYISSKSCADVD
jgi:hypothetical protein